MTAQTWNHEPEWPTGKDGGHTSWGKSFISSIKVAFVVLLGFLLISIPMPVSSQSFGKVKAKAPPKEDRVPEDLVPGQVKSYLAGPSDEQARKMLAAELKKKGTAKSGEEADEQVGEEEKGLVFAFFAAQSWLSNLSGQIGGIIAGAHTWYSGLRFFESASPEVPRLMALSGHPPRSGCG